MMWLLAERTGDPWWRDRAEHYSRLLEHRQHDRDVHDLGFIFLNTYLPWYRLTGDERLHEVLITGGPHAGAAVQPEGAVPPLVRRAREPVHRHHDERADHLLRGPRDRRPGPLRPGRRPLPDDRADARPARRLDGPRGDLRPRRPASSSARRPTRACGRLGLDPRPGLVALRLRHGLSPTRGDPADLAVAERNADYYLARCPEGLVPPWDFDVPAGPDRIDDSSAGAIAASGLWNLRRASTPTTRPTRPYRDAALTILDSLCTDRYLAWNDARLGRRRSSTASTTSTRSWASTSRSCGATSSSWRRSAAS